MPSPRPFLIWAIAAIFSVHSVVVPICVLYFLLAGQDATFTYNDEPAKVADYRIELVFGFLAWGLLAFATAYGYWKRRSWSRHIIPTIHAIALVQIAFFDPDPALPFLLIYVVLVFWYFYRKENVRSYFGVAS